MSPRERNLLILFASAGFIVLNLFGFSALTTQKQAFQQKREAAETNLILAEGIRDESEKIQEDITWLTEHEPKPAAKEDVQTQLQQLVESEARSSGLTIKSQKALPSTPGIHYHRAKIEISISGTEDAFYGWLDRLNSPDQLRIASQINLRPNPQDDTKIDCTTTVEQWFIPQTTDAPSL